MYMYTYVRYVHAPCAVHIRSMLYTQFTPEIQVFVHLVKQICTHGFAEIKFNDMDYLSS